jgi:predicted MFS family arabinose efflux permease
MLVPFLFFEYPIGWLADKELGEKEMIIFFLSFMALATAWVYTLDRPVVWLWALALFLTRIGASAMEILRDSYFYKKIDGNDVDLIDFYRTARPMAYILAAGLSVLVVDTYSVREIFLLASLVLLTGLWPAWMLKDNLSEREMLILAKKTR